MAISKDLLLAILSLDAYNQGYSKGISHGKKTIGSATFYDDKGDEEAQSAGFYAVAYELDGGTPMPVVVSDRDRNVHASHWRISLSCMNIRGGVGRPRSATPPTFRHCRA